jgi:hypothetical protein
MAELSEIYYFDKSTKVDDDEKMDTKLLVTN